MQMPGVKENRVSIKSIIARVAEDVIDIWKRAAIPIKKETESTRYDQEAMAA